MSIRWKLALLCLILTLLPMMVLNRYAVRAFDRFTRRAHEEQMINYAFVVGDEYRRQLETGETDLHFVQRLQHYQDRFRTRLQIIGADGVILLDSAVPSAAGGQAGQDREIREAFAGGYGARNALTKDRALMYYYIALPLHDAAGEVIGAVRAIAHTREITRAILRITTDFRRAMAIAFGVASLAAILLSSTMTRRLRRLTRAVKHFAHGDSLMTLDPRGHDEIAELSRACDQMAHEISRNNTRQGNLLASTTHELKTPLTAIKGAAQLLRDEGAMDDPQARERFLTHIEMSADGLLRMVEQLAALSKLKAEELRGRKEPVRIGKLIRATVDRLFPAPPVVIDLDLPSCDPVVAVIPERIEQVLVNILDNAIRYTPAEGRITVKVEPGETDVAIAVCDTGCGIAPADLPHVFRQFFTTEPRNSLRDYGSGLGLAIAQSIIQNHGGTIRAESQPGQGSVFTFTLPL